MEIGELNERICFLRRTDKQDEIGQDIQEFEEYKTVWAAVKPLRGREYWEAKKIQSEEIYKIKIRYLKQITPDMVVKYKNRILEIISISDVNGKKFELEIQCKEKIEKEREEQIEPI